MNEEQARQTYIQLQILEEHIQKLQQHLEEIDEKTVELRKMINTVEEITKLDKEEILIPITNGIFIEANTKKPEQLYLGIGAGTTIKKTPEETKKLLEEQQVELAEYRKKLLGQQQTLIQQVTSIQEELNEELSDV